jgi:hypothetical protein
MGQRGTLEDRLIGDAFQDMPFQLGEAMFVTIGDIIRVMECQDDPLIFTVFERFACRFIALDGIPDDLTIRSGARS